MQNASEMTHILQNSFCFTKLFTKLQLLQDQDRFKKGLLPVL